MNTDSQIETSFKNPFKSPIKTQWKNLKGLKWEFPLIPSFVQFIVYILTLVLFILLYPTIGIISQVKASLWDSILKSVTHFKNADNIVEKSSYVIAILLTSIIIIPFYLIELPFVIIGKLGAKTIITIVIISFIIWIVFTFKANT